ncbi:MAG TPA: diguanylate cyclase, partial [Gemmatimonadales bacterium]|nr:diguanylate cyclase [Gemmatimonadales bacterium]
SPEAEAAGPEEPLDEEVQRIAEQVGQLFKRTGRSSDAIGRLGQSEFAVIAPATSSEGALRLIQRLGGTIESSPIPVRGGERYLKVRAGYCAVPDFAESPVDAVELLLRATTALRDLKRDGDAEQVRAFDQTPLSYPT